MSANETQVGGTHYKTPFQHWDLVHELDLGYFEGQISKYLTRHRFKKGKEDAEKALHFTKKLHELALFNARQPRHKYATIARMMEYVESNKLLPLEQACIMSACNWSMPQDLEMLAERIERLIRECYPPKQEQLFDDQDKVWNKLGGLQDGSEPGPGYVDQGRDI